VFMLTRSCAAAARGNGLVPTEWAWSNGRVWLVWAPERALVKRGARGGGRVARAQIALPVPTHKCGTVKRPGSALRCRLWCGTVPLHQAQSGVRAGFSCASATRVANRKKVSNAQPSLALPIAGPFQAPFMSDAADCQEIRRVARLRNIKIGWAALDGVDPRVYDAARQPPYEDTHGARGAGGGGGDPYFPSPANASLCS
jgi:hypothetical protein